MIQNNDVVKKNNRNKVILHTFSTIHIIINPIHNKLILVIINNIIQVTAQILSPGIIIQGEIIQVVIISINDNNNRQLPDI